MSAISAEDEEEASKAQFLSVLFSLASSGRYDFPPRLQACQEVVKLVQSHPIHRIVLGVDSLGKGDKRQDPPENSRVQSCSSALTYCMSRSTAKTSVFGVCTEELLAAVAAAAGERVWVPAARFTALTLLGLPAQQLFTTDNSSARIIALSRHQACLPLIM